MSSRGIGVEGSCVDLSWNGTYVCKYVPTVAGSYLLGITLDALHVRKSPYAVLVSVGAASGARCISSDLATLVRNDGQGRLHVQPLVLLYRLPCLPCKCVCVRCLCLRIRVYVCVLR